VVICPGGGHYILAYDLEGTEVAEWLNSIGVTGIVLKYRVPSRDPQKRCVGGGAGWSASDEPGAEQSDGMAIEPEADRDSWILGRVNWLDW